MKKNFGAFGAGQFSLDTLVGGRPGTTIFQNPGGGGGWGGLGLNAQDDNTYSGDSGLYKARGSEERLRKRMVS